MSIAETIRGLLPFGRLKIQGKSLESGTPGVEGQPKEGPWLVNGGWLPAEWGYWNFFQMDYDPLSPGSGSAIVEACIAAYAQTIAMCPGDHWKALPNGGRERVTTSALSRILRRPNDYQSRSDFMLGLAANLYRDGNAYCLATRNDRFEVSALHPFDPRQSHALTDGSGNVFYELAGNSVVDKQFSGNGTAERRLPGSASTSSIVVPARDVFHVKLEAERGQPLTGVPPARHAAAAIAAQRAIGSQMSSIFGNLNRPAGVIETEHNLNQETIDKVSKHISEAWRDIDNLDRGPPILTNNMKWKSVSMSAKDAEVPTMLRLSQDEIFMAFGVPPAILGMTDRSTFASTEALMQFWLARGLGFAINHIETSMDHFFGLPSWPTEYVEFDTSALLRVAFKDRIEALARGVQGGIYAPNEARRFEELPAAEAGDEPRVQQQVVPLSAWEKQPPQTPRPDAPEASPPAAATEEEEESGEEEESRDWTGFTLRALTDDRARETA